jgi:hypothetical protein
MHDVMQEEMEAPVHSCGCRGFVVTLNPVKANTQQQNPTLLQSAPIGMQATTALTVVSKGATTAV